VPALVEPTESTIIMILGLMILTLALGRNLVAPALFQNHGKAMLLRWPMISYMCSADGMPMERIWTISLH
jgi:hypothetical protein